MRIVIPLQRFLEDKTIITLNSNYIPIEFYPFTSEIIYLFYTTVTYQTLQRRRENGTNKSLKLVRQLGSALHLDWLCEPGNTMREQNSRYQEL